MPADKLPLGQASSLAASILAPPPVQPPPPSYEESSSSRLPPAYIGPSRSQRNSTSNDRNEHPFIINSLYVGPARTSSTPSSPQPYPSWVQRNLTATKITVFLMIAVAIAHIVFAGVVAKDLKDDPGDYRCAYNYIFGADEPASGDQWTVASPDGQFHADCRLLYHWSQLLTAAASLTAIRALLQAAPVQKPQGLTFEGSSGGHRSFGSFYSPSIIYMIRTFFSLTICVLYLTCALILCTNRFITGPPAMDSYRTIYLGSMGIIWLSFLITAQQTAATGIASWFLRGWKELPQERVYTPSI